MKFIIAALLCLTATPALAGGEFQTVMSAYEGKGGPYPTVALSMDQHLIGSFGMSGYVGFGSRPNDDETVKYWSSMKLALDYHQNDFATWSLGGAVSKGKLADTFKEGGERMMYVKFAGKLW